MSKPAHAGGPCGRRNVTSSTQTRRVAMQMGRPLRGLGDDHATVVLGLACGSPRAILARPLRGLCVGATQPLVVRSAQFPEPAKGATEISLG